MIRIGREGFTLVEVLSVLAILALLAALILGLAGLAQKKAVRSRAESEIAQLANFLAGCQMQYGRVPRTRGDLAAALQAARHPLAHLTDPWGNSYEYEASSQATFYLWSTAGAPGNPGGYIGTPRP